MIGIIALLISILLPSLIKARRNAYNVKCLANLHQIGLAFASYGADYKGVAPPPRADIAATSGSSAGYFYWQEALWLYLLPKTPFPTDAYSTTSTHSWLNGTVFACPRGELDGETGDFLSTGYSMNQDLPQG